MKNTKKLIVIGLFVFLAGFIAYFFLFGRLFPYSPVILGFSKHELNNSTIYIQNRAEFYEYETIDTLILSVEKFHDLKFKQKPKLFIFRDSLAYIHHSPTKARFCAFSNGRLIISPWAIRENAKGKISLAIYVRHELSHVLILQHKGLFSELNYPKWLLEGIAVYSANQMGTSFYPSKEETYQIIAQGNFLPPFDFKTRRENKTHLDVKYRITFMYSEFACLVDYLVLKYGKAKFLLYMKGLIKSNDHDKVFRQIYGIDFDKFISDFRQFVRKNEHV
ncbi:MAG: hypothetical protein JXA77_15895 [Bacteroidales bacterium]|nr:hypothetical protein [Bacteroidales bacterium]MBN2817467.1 hypothetical protein [Bacteroidales bacterium]